MTFREVPVHEIRETIRLWLHGEGYRSIARLARVDRRTAKGYIAAAEALGLRREQDESAISDELIAGVVEAVRPVRPKGHGEAWESLLPRTEQIKAWLGPKEGEGLTLVKVHQLLGRSGLVVPYRTLHRFAVENCGFGNRPRATVRVADCEPGSELQVDFGRMGLVADPEAGRRRVLWALIFTAVYSRHCYVWLSFRQTTEAVIAGFEAAWAFFEGIFAVVIPDNMSAIVDEADAVSPRFNRAFYDYAQCRGFLVDPAMVASPTQKPRVERQVPYVRSNFFAGESFIDRDDAQRRVEAWCRVTAGLRVHGTTCKRPAEVFAAEEAPALARAPESPYAVPLYARSKVHRDHCIEVGRALYSVPGNLIGQHVEVRADAELVRISHRGVVVKVHPRKPRGTSSIDAADLPEEKTAYAMRDVESLRHRGAAYGQAIGAYVDALLDHPLPWTRMRAVYRLLGLVKRYGAEAVEAACGTAMEAEAVDVGLISRMCERGAEAAPQPRLPGFGKLLKGRFARDASEFATRGQAR